MMTIEEKIKTLLPEAKKEANDFIDFLIEKTHKEDKQWHLLVSEKAIDKIWDIQRTMFTMNYSKGVIILLLYHFPDPLISSTICRHHP